jgi:DNA repair exonuclease SbcCD ATPase subunit
LLEGVDKGEDEDNILLKTSIDKMKNFMIETLERLDNAREKYQSAVEIFDNLNSSIETQTEVLDKVLKADTADFRKQEKYKEKIDVVCRWANIFTFGLCGIIHCHVNTIPLEEAKEALEQLTTLAENMFEKGNQLTHDIDEAIAILTEEIELINEWANSAENVKRNIDEYPEKYLAKYISIKTIFINGLNDLSEVAEKFIAPPPTIW